MHIECTQENLAKALSVVSRMVGTRGTLPVLGNILLQVEKGRLKLAATDLELGIQTWVGGKVEQEGSITIPARLLVDFVVTNSDPTIRLETKETTLHLTSQRFQANIKGIDASEFPLIPALAKTNPIELAAHELKTAILQTVFATALDETRPVLTGVLFRLEDTQLKLVATDSYRLAERSIILAKTHPKMTIIVPARTLQELARMLSDQIDIVTMYLADNQIMFTFGETEFISRLIDGNFPDYEQIIPKQTTTDIQVPKGTLAQVMKMASFFARESANNVQLKVDGNSQVKVAAISPQLGDAISELQASVTGEPIEIAFNAKFILDALTVFPTEQVHINLSGKLQPGLLRPHDRSDYLYLIMPLRIDS